MAIFSDLELNGIMNKALDKEALNEDHASLTAELDLRDTKKRVSDRVGEAKKKAEKGINNLKDNSWLVQHKAKETANKKQEWKRVGKTPLYHDGEGRGILWTDEKSVQKVPHEDGVSFKGKKSAKKKITFKEDANGNIIDCELEGEEEYVAERAAITEATVDDSYISPFLNGDFSERGIVDALQEGLISKAQKKKIEKAQKEAEKKLDDSKVDLTNKTAVAIEKEKQDWHENPGAKTGEFIGDVVTGGNLVNTGAKFLGRKTGGAIDRLIHNQEKKRKANKEDTDWRNIYRSDEYTRAMNEYFDITDRETRKVLLAVNEADQNKVLVSLTSKLYDNVVDRVDDIDFGEIERTRGDIQALPNFPTLHECLNNMARLLIEFKQDTKPIDTIAESVSNIIESKNIWTKAYAINAELPMITYNTITLAIIEATSYMVSMCVDFVKSPSQDTMQIMIDKSALTKSKGHLLFKNLESFNEAYRKGQVDKAMNHILDEAASKKTLDPAKKNFLGLGIYTGGAAVAAVIGVAGLLFCIIPIIRELIFLFFYYRVRISEFFDVQADLLQVNAYNVQNNRLDLTKDERKKISTKQMKVAEDFRKVAKKIAVDGAAAEKSASKDIKVEDSKKYKAEEIMDELPDSAASALF